MPVDEWTDLQRMVSCGGAVAAGVIPLAAGSWLLSRRAGTTLLPKLRPWRAPWGGFEVVVAFLILGPFLLPSLVADGLSKSSFFTLLYGHDFPARQPHGPEPEQPDAQERRAEAHVVRTLWAGLISFPIQLGIVLITASSLYPQWRWVRRGPVAARLAIVGVAWFALSIGVHGVHLIVNLVFGALGWTPDSHSLSMLANRPTLDRILFILEASVRAPLLEELSFRGVLLVWLLGRSYRVWPVLVGGIVMAVVSCMPTANGIEILTRGPVIFSVLLVIAWPLLGRFIHRKQRTIGAIYASAALFAAVHSSVWPTPIPLFVLGLGLGWLAVRTQGFLIPAAVHGLFNLVSVLFVLLSS